MRVLLLGSGGRESALAWALDRSSAVSEVIAAPGNPGIARVAEIVALDPEDPGAVTSLARRCGAALVVVGPEAPLVAGVGDALRDTGRLVFGPDAAAAAVEGSKSYAKLLMESAGIPTARGIAVRSLEEGIEQVDALGPPYVIKADGLAAGKGVVVTSDRSEAIDALEQRLSAGAFGEAGRTCVIEEFLDGPELSLIAFVDGRTAVACAPAQDYKRLLDHDGGPNTGGMGSYSPVPACDDDVAERIAAEVIEPMAAELHRRGTPFVGALYAGLVLTPDGPKVIEFNARFGDPETQALLPRLRSDLGELCLACARGELQGARLRWSSRACVTVVLASEGYPEAPTKGAVISGMERAEAIEGVQVFHAATQRRGEELVTAGGRVLAVSALGDGFGQARARAYEAAAEISFDGLHLRHDIAARAEAAEARTGAAVSV